MSDSSSDEDMDFTPAELLETVEIVPAELSCLPEKSRDKYIQAYDMFTTWRDSKGLENSSETTMLSYFTDTCKEKKASTLWSIYSMLKATIKANEGKHIETYPELIAFLKKKSTGYKPKKSKTFTASEIERFLTEAPDYDYLATKVALIIGISGACRSADLTYLTMKNIERHSKKLLLVRLPTAKNIERTFVIRYEYAKLVEKYQALRPPKTPIDRFFLQYRNGQCVRQPMGNTTVGGLPRKIAGYLGLKNPEQYTGHCFRRTSAELLKNPGADLTTLIKIGGRKANIASEIEEYIEKKSKICKVEGGITLQQSRPDHCTRPSTSRKNDIIQRALVSADLPPVLEPPGLRHSYGGETCCHCNNIIPPTASLARCVQCAGGALFCAHCLPNAHAHHAVMQLPNAKTYRVLEKIFQQLRLDVNQLLSKEAEDEEMEPGEEHQFEVEVLDETADINATALDPLNVKEEYLPSSVDNDEYADTSETSHVTSEFEAEVKNKPGRAMTKRKINSEEHGYSKRGRANERIATERDSTKPIINAQSTMNLPPTTPTPPNQSTTDILAILNTIKSIQSEYSQCTSMMDKVILVLTHLGQYI